MTEADVEYSVLGRCHLACHRFIVRALIRHNSKQFSICKVSEFWLACILQPSRTSFSSLFLSRTFHDFYSLGKNSACNCKQSQEGHISIRNKAWIRLSSLYCSSREKLWLEATHPKLKFLAEMVSFHLVFTEMAVIKCQMVFAKIAPCRTTAMWQGLADRHIARCRMMTARWVFCFIFFKSSSGEFFYIFLRNSQPHGPL